MIVKITIIGHVEKERGEEDYFLLFLEIMYPIASNEKISANSSIPEAVPVVCVVSAAVTVTVTTSEAELPR